MKQKSNKTGASNPMRKKRGVEREIIVNLPPPDPEGVRRFARLLVEWAQTDVLEQKDK